MLNWAVARGHYHNPAAAMQEDDAGKPRERFLEDEEIAALWPALTMLKRPVELALKLALVTGQRIGEVCGMTEEEIDSTKSIWTIPAEVKKRRGAHRPAVRHGARTDRGRTPHGHQWAPDQPLA